MKRLKSNLKTIVKTHIILAKIIFLYFIFYQIKLSCLDRNKSILDVKLKVI